MSELYLLVAIIWFVLEFTKFSRTRKIIAIIAVSLIALHSVDMAIYRGKSTHLIASRMKVLSEYLEKGEVKKVQVVLKNISEDVDSGKDIALSLGDQDRLIFPHFYQENRANGENRSPQQAPHSSGLKEE